jgi:hypothetical protein
MAHSAVISQLAKHSGVAEADVAKLLKALGHDTLFSEVEKTLGKEKASELKVSDLKLAVRLGRSSVMV